MSTLAEHLISDGRPDEAPDPFEQPIDEVESSTFRVTDRSSATWAIRVLAKIKSDIADAKAEAAEERDRIARWLQKTVTPLERSVAYFEGLLIEYHRGQRAADEKHNKTIALPGGTLKSTATQANVQVDEDTFLPWAEEQSRDDLLRRKVEVDKAAVKDAALKQGEVLPGVATTEPSVKYTVVVEAEAAE